MKTYLSLENTIFSIVLMADLKRKTPFQYGRIFKNDLFPSFYLRNKYSNTLVSYSFNETYIKITRKLYDKQFSIKDQKIYKCANYGEFVLFYKFFRERCLSSTTEWLVT